MNKFKIGDRITYNNKGHMFDNYNGVITKVTKRKNDYCYNITYDMKGHLGINIPEKELQLYKKPLTSEQQAVNKKLEEIRLGLTEIKKYMCIRLDSIDIDKNTTKYQVIEQVKKIIDEDFKNINELLEMLK